MAKDNGTKILKKLSAMEKEEGKLPLLLQFFRDILGIQVAVARKIGTPRINLAADTVRDRIEQKIPILSFEDLDIDLGLFQDTLIRVTDTFTKYTDLFGDIPEKLRQPEAARLLNQEVIRAWFNGEALPLAISTNSNDAVIRAIIQSAFKPMLTVYAEVLIEYVEQEKWRQKYCPVCGGIPDMAFLEAEHGARYLLCCRCDSEWLYQRLQCPYCGTQDTDSLSFFTDEKGLYQLNVCDKCRRYLKTIDMRKADNEVLMPLERLLTTEMDRQAREEGYILMA